MEQELRKALQHSSLKCGDATVLRKLSAAAEQHGLTGKQMASKLSAWLVNQGADSTGTLGADTASDFADSLSRTLGKENQQKRSNVTPASKWGARSWDELTDTVVGSGLKAAAAPPGTPTTPLLAASPLAAGPTPHSAFATRSNSGQVASSLNSDLAVEGALAPATPVVVQAVGPQLPSRHLYQVERLEDKVAAMQARMEAAVAAAQAALGDAWSDPVALGTPVQEDSFFFGRIVSDAESGTLNAASVLLEGDAHLSEGVRCPLDLSQLPSFRLFPGQVVVVRGINPTGNRIIARHIYTHLPPPAPRANQLRQLEASAAAAPGLQLSMVAAAGPFCLLEDLSYAPLASLLQQLAAAPPQVLLLLGPFVDVENPAVAGGMMDVTFQQLFQQQVVARLSAWQRELQRPCQVVLVPSVRDVHHHPTFPQPSFTLPVDAEVVSLQNPASFEAGGVRVSTTTQDVVRHLSPLELSGGQQTDRLAALSSHLLGQRCMYPLYPPHPSACLDTTADYALRLEQLPHLLLLPSDLAPFAKVTGGAGGPTGAGSSTGEEVVTINPGRLAKGNGGGTYARISVLDVDGSDKAFSSRCRVDIVRV